MRTSFRIASYPHVAENDFQRIIQKRAPNRKPNQTQDILRCIHIIILYLFGTVSMCTAWRWVVHVYTVPNKYSMMILAQFKISSVWFCFRLSALISWLRTGSLCIWTRSRTHWWDSGQTRIDPGIQMFADGRPDPFHRDRCWLLHCGTDRRHRSSWQDHLSHPGRYRNNG